MLYDGTQPAFVRSTWRIGRGGTLYAFSRFENRSLLMTKSLDVIKDAIRSTKHPFRQVDDRPDKPKKHRYERRKIREYLRLSDWSAEGAS